MFYVEQFIRWFESNWAGIAVIAFLLAVLFSCAQVLHFRKHEYWSNRYETTILLPFYLVGAIFRPKEILEPEGVKYAYFIRSIIILIVALIYLYSWFAL